MNISLDRVSIQHNKERRMSIEPSETVRKAWYRGGWHGPKINLKGRLYVIDAATVPPIVGSILLAHCVTHAGNHRCMSNKGRNCNCLYINILVARARRHAQDSNQVAIRGFLQEEARLPAGSGRTEPLILPQHALLIGELFLHDKEPANGWFAPPLP